MFDNLRRNPLVDALAAMDGLQANGGCDSCDAEQELINRGGGIFVLQIAHDSDCPVLARKGRK